jgi:nicotinate phosphoribosyltransferase
VCLFKYIKTQDGEVIDFVDLCNSYLAKLKKLFNRINECNEGELASFIAYAIAYPDNFLVLIDTYDTLK